MSAFACPLFPRLAFTPNALSEGAARVGENKDGESGEIHLLPQVCDFGQVIYPLIASVSSCLNWGERCLSRQFIVWIKRR